jgi:hypothetical protein
MRQILLNTWWSFTVMFGFFMAGAQTAECIKQTVFKIDFGAGDSQDMNLSFLRNYRLERGDCPQDGFYSFTSSTYSCFDGNWINVPEDHTMGDINGKMLLVNASEKPGEFFLLRVLGMKSNTAYELSAWLVNVCRRTIGCRMIYPNIDFVVVANGNEIARFTTGELLASEIPLWRRYATKFITPTISGDVFIRLVNNERGGCGNDFALDDMLLTRCEIPPPPAEEVNPPAVIKTVSKPKPVIPNEKPSKSVKTDTVVTKMRAPEKVPVNTPILKESVVVNMPQPAVLKTRSNPVIKQIFTDSAELNIELYDNGVIDGDTVSIYHNGEMVISRAALTARAIGLKIRCDAQHPHHELVMVADNLGSIPPNTSLMIVTARDKRYEVFISSDDKKNARVVIDFKQ